METSSYFERTLFYDRSPAADEYYERSADLIFEKDTRRTQIEVRYQPTCDYDQTLQVHEEQSCGQNLSIPKNAEIQSLDFQSADFKISMNDSVKLHYGTKAIETERGNRAQDPDEACESDSDSSTTSKASSTALPLGLDQWQGEAVPPTYPGLPKLKVVTLDASDIPEFVKWTKNSFRVFYIRQRHSYSRIQITKKIFEQLLKSCNVFPRFNEYLIGFGIKQNDNEVGPPPLKFRALSTSNGNAYRGFECSYILRYIEYTNRPGGQKPWSLRQYAIYHRYKPGDRSRCSTWLLVGASQRTERRIDHYTRSVPGLSNTNPFELHVIFFDTVIASWRPYLVHLTQLVKFQSDKADGITIGHRESGANFHSIEVEDHQNLKQIEDDLSDLLLCLDSTLDTVATFHELYDQSRTLYASFGQTRNQSLERLPSIDAVEFALKEKTKETMYLRKKAEALLAKLRNARTLISSLLERQSGHNIDQQISALNTLERQGQDENIIMRQLAEKSSRDSSSMRILTIITMIYLPCTIVSNFFSTQFVNSKESDSGKMTLEYANNAWLFFAISVPLTLMTILIWYLWVNSELVVRFINRRKMGQGRLARRSRLVAQKEPTYV